MRNFIEAVGRNYQPNPYHNFLHGFSVMHIVFLTCRQQVWGPLGPQNVFRSIVCERNLHVFVCPVDFHSPRSLHFIHVYHAFCFLKFFVHFPVSRFYLPPPLCLWSRRQSFADFMTPVELLAMLIAALCHDLQHPGTNNVLQINACSDLAIRSGRAVWASAGGC